MVSEIPTLSYEQRLQTQQELHDQIRKLAENLRDQQTLRDQNTADLSTDDQEAIQQLYAEADAALLKARADVQTLRSKLGIPTTDNPWDKLDTTALNLKRGEDLATQFSSEPPIAPPGEEVTETPPDTDDQISMANEAGVTPSQSAASDRFLEEPVVITVPPVTEEPFSEEPANLSSDHIQDSSDEEPVRPREQTIQLNYREQNIQNELNQKVLRLKGLMEKSQSDSLLSFLQDPRLVLLQEQNFRHADRRLAVKWLEELMAPYELQELVETAVRLRDDFRKRANPENFSQVLGVSINAQPEEVRTAYRTLMRLYGMDLFKGLDTDEHRTLWKELNDINLYINRAYEAYNEDRPAFVRNGKFWESKAGDQSKSQAEKNPAQQEARQSQEAQQSIDRVLNYLKQYFSGENHNRRDDFSNTARELYYGLQQISRQSGESETIVICNTKDNNNDNSLGDAASKHTADRFASDINRFPHLFAKVERGDRHESAYVLVITVQWEATDQAKQQQRAEQPQKPGWASSESQQERRAAGLQQQLERAPSIRDIVSILKQLDQLGFSWTATKNGQAVERQPSEIIRQIEEAILEAKFGYNWPLLEQKLQSITHIFKIHDKVKQELMPVFCVRVVENTAASLSDSVWALQQLEQVSFRIPVTSRSGAQYRDPAQILRQMGEIQLCNAEGKKRNLSRVNELIVELTSLGNLDVKLYRKIREGWNAWEKLRFPIPEALKSRFEE